MQIKMEMRIHQTSCIPDEILNCTPNQTQQSTQQHTLRTPKLTQQSTPRCHNITDLIKHHKIHHVKLLILELHVNPPHLQIMVYRKWEQCMMMGVFELKLSKECKFYFSNMSFKYL